MIIQIDEQYHDKEGRTYYVEIERLKAKNPVDVLVSKASQKKAFNQRVYIDVDKKRETEDSEFWWNDPQLSNGVKVKLPKGTKPEKVIKLTLSFDC